MKRQVLKLSKSGMPIGWMPIEEAARIISKNQNEKEKLILWTMGENAFSLRGGMNSKTGKQSFMNIPAIICVNEKGGVSFYNNVVRFTADACKNREAFLCAYCGEKFSRSHLTIDHVFPKSRGGELSFENTAAACLKCNNKKGNRTPDEAKMPLLVKPFVPNKAEAVYSQKIGHMLSIQEEYLRLLFKNNQKRNYLKEVSFA